MAKMIYVSPMSLDGYIAQDHYDWSPPGDEGLAFITNTVRPVGTYLYGRKMYETMAVWERPEVIPGFQAAPLQDYAKVWQSAEKIIFSKSLPAVSTGKTRLEREFDPQAIRALKAQLTHNLTVGGPNLAAQAIRAGLVDEYQLFVVPKVLGGGIPVLPRDVVLDLMLLEERRFGNGWVFLHYQARR